MWVREERGGGLILICYGCLYGSQDGKVNIITRLELRICHFAFLRGNGSWRYSC